MEEPKVEIIIPKVSCHRKDSFWYKGDGQIATVTHKGRTLSIEPRGEIRVCFTENGDCFRNEDAVSEASRRGLGDKRMGKLGEHDGWLNNNWFVIIELDKEGNDVDDDLFIGYDYDEMINEAVKMAKEF